jgi:hypothetical protein
LDYLRAAERDKADADLATLRRLQSDSGGFRSGTKQKRAFAIEYEQMAVVQDPVTIKWSDRERTRIPHTDIA